MFAKPATIALARAPRSVAPQPENVRVSALIRLAVANPVLGAGGAAGLVLLSGAVLVLATADPRAGAPTVRVAIGGADSKIAEVPGLRPGQAPADPLMAGVVLTNAPPGGQGAPALGAGPGLGPPIGAQSINGQIAGGPIVGDRQVGSAQVGGQAVFMLPQGASVRGEGSGGVMSAVGSTIANSPASAGAPVSTAKPFGPPLPRAPFAGLTAPGPDGPLPTVAADGRSPLSAYRRPFADAGKPKVALVIGGLGLNAEATRQAIERLPPEVTLSFVPYADNLQSWVDQARNFGHEVTLDIPMEPVDYPNNDPGPQTLMADGSATDNGKKLDWLLSRAQGFFGVTNYLGGRFVASAAGMAGFTGALKARGLAFIDDGSARKFGGAAARASADAVVDEQLSAEQIDRSLLALEAKALAKGSALGTGFAYPVTVEQVLRWNVGLTKRGYQLAPASAILRR